MNYQILRDIQRNERRQELGRVPNNFYEDCRIFLRKLVKEYKETQETEKRIIAENTMEIIREITDNRYEKIVHAAATGKKLDNMVGSEKNLYYNLNKTFNEYKEDYKENTREDDKNDEYNLHYSRQNQQWISNL